MKPQLLIASLSPGSGKTLLTIGLSNIMKRNGMRVQSYKCGPDFIDPLYLSVITEKDCINLDRWYSSSSHIQHIYNRYGEKSDICITEGNGGLFDGYEKTKGSCSEIAELLHIPVILLINARGLGYSVTAMISGFKSFNPHIKIAGVIFNQIVSVGQYNYLRQACIDSETECFGYIPYISDIKLPSKHSAITINVKKNLLAMKDRISEIISKSVDVNKILDVCNRNFPCQYILPYSSDFEDNLNIINKKLNIAVARDVAFCYLYKENLRRMSEIGNISYFSPVYSQDIPECDILYLPAGVPELFARQLHRRRKMLDSIKEFAEKGGKILAEGASIALLSKSLTVREDGTAYDMSGIFTFECDTIGSKLHSGYKSIKLDGKEIKGYDYHYCNIENHIAESTTDIKQFNVKGVELPLPIFRYKNVIASLGSLYWGENDILELWKKRN